MGQTVELKASFQKALVGWIKLILLLILLEFGRADIQNLKSLDNLLGKDNGSGTLKGLQQEKENFIKGSTDKSTDKNGMIHFRKRREDCEQYIPDELKHTTFQIPRGYNFFEIPFQPKIGNTTPPLNVTMRARVEDIRDIDEVTEEITLDMEITLGWTDWILLAHRRNFTKEQLADYIKKGEHLKRIDKLITLNNPRYLKAIWKPNLFVYDLIDKTQPKLMTDLITLRYDPDGGFVYYQTRVILKLSCPMVFTHYPADIHECQFVVRGFSYGEEFLNLQWYKPPFLAVRDESNFIVQLSSFNSDKIQIREQRFNGLSFTLMLRRKMAYHVIQTYIPSSFLIIITWLCFLMPSTMIEARIGISMTTLLTLTAMFSSVRETSPVTAYIKALDLWMVSCIFSVFLTLFEFTLFTWFRHLKLDSDERAKKKLEKANKKRVLLHKGVIEDVDTNLKETSKLNTTTAKKEKKDSKKFEFYMKMIEKFAFAVFFVSFVIYNAVYWSWLLICSGVLSWPQVNPELNALTE